MDNYPDFEKWAHDVIQGFAVKNVHDESTEANQWILVIFFKGGSVVQIIPNFTIECSDKTHLKPSQR